MSVLTEFWLDINIKIEKTLSKTYRKLRKCYNYQSDGCKRLFDAHSPHCVNRCQSYPSAKFSEGLHCYSSIELINVFAALTITQFIRSKVLQYSKIFLQEKISLTKLSVNHVLWLFFWDKFRDGAIFFETLRYIYHNCSQLRELP